MRYGASTFIWVSPFSNKTLDLLDKAKAFGFDILEICTAARPARAVCHGTRSRTPRATCGTKV
jgi:D-psicose/D-tagatose/L-ribulose 3-epimerase